MKQRTLGQSGIQASTVGFGAWAIGGWMWGGTDEAESIRAIQAGIDAGINLIDTAPAYGFGLSEELVGKAIRDRRDKVVLATKCGLVWHVAKGDFFFTSGRERTGDGDLAVYKYLGPESIRYEVEQSLQRLQTDVIDLYQTHWQESTTPREETMAALLTLKDEGKIRAIGVSNVTVDQLRDYELVGPVDSVQEKYSMLDRGKEEAVLPYCADHKLAFLAYSPIAQGLLTGKVDPDREFPEGDQRRTSPRFSRENRQRVQRMLDSYRSVADQHGISLAQLAIAWTVQQRGSSHALVGARNEEQARENAGAGDVVLSEADLATINGAIADYQAASA